MNAFSQIIIGPGYPIPIFYSISILRHFELGRYFHGLLRRIQPGCQDEKLIGGYWESCYSNPALSTDQVRYLLGARTIGQS